jgi:hypothetical protein
MPLALRPVNDFLVLLVARYCHDYYSQSAPRCPLLPKPAFLLQERQRGSPVAVWLLGWGRVGFRTRSPGLGALRTGPLTGSGVSGLPNRPCGFASRRYSLVYSSPGIKDRVCQPWFGHVSPSPLTD